MADVHDFDLFAAGKAGSFKGISIDLKNDKKDICKNIQSFKTLTSDEHEITALAWGNSDEKEVLIGLAGQKVKIYDTDFKAFSSNLDINCGSGGVRGLSRYNEFLLTAVESGHVKIWSYSQENVLETLKPIEKMKHNPYKCEIIATGGKENDLKLWDLEKKECTFSAKNVKENMLQLRVPIWVTDIGFLRGGDEIVTCSRYGHVRLYDPRTPQRRPVVSTDIPEQTLISMEVAPRDNQVIVGSGTGKIMLLDMRRKEKVVQHYKGAAGSVKSIACHKTEPYVVSVGMDRHLLVHNFHSRALVRKIYLKTRLNCVLLRTDAFTKVRNDSKPEKNKNDSDNGLEIVESDYDEPFNNMETVEEPSRKRMRKIKT